MTPPDLSNIPFFQGIGDQQLWHLTRAGQLTDYPADSTLFNSGEPRKAFWVILEGNLAIEAVQNGLPHRLSTLGPGDVIGESILLDEHTHSTTGRATLPLKAMRFSKEALEPLLKDKPQLYAALVSRSARAIRDRLRQADASLTGQGRLLGYAATGRTRREHDPPGRDLVGQRSPRREGRV